MGTVRIGDKDVEMVANALTPVLYKKVFHRDFLQETQKKDLDFTIFQELGYIMSKQAEGLSVKELTTTLSENGYYEWLMDFGAMEIMEKVNDIFAIYNRQAKATSKSKKNP